MSRMNAEQAMHLALVQEMERDSTVLLFGEGAATKHRDLAERFGAQRVRNTPLAEAIIAGTAVGAAANGLRPVADLLFAPFLAYAMDALLNSAGKLRAISGGQFSFPLVVKALTGTGWCVGGQHNHNLEAMFVHSPGLKVVMPALPEDFLGLMKAAIRDPDPVLFFVDMALLYQEGEVPDDPEYLVPLGKAALRRQGDDVSLVAYGKTVGVCEKAAAQLSEQGVEADVLDLRSLKPLDRDAVLTSVRKTGRLVVVTEASGLCGMAAELAALVVDKAFSELRAPVLRLTGPDAPAPSSWALEQAAIPTPEQVVEAVRGLLGTT